MANRQTLLEGELFLLLEKKLSLLTELFQLAKKQISLVDELELETVFYQKDQFVKAMQKTDAIIAMWHQEHLRVFNEREQSLLEYIQTGIEDILELEQQFERQLQQEKASISAEMEQLRNRSQVRNYLGGQSAAGKNLSFRR